MSNARLFMRCSETAAGPEFIGVYAGRRQGRGLMFPEIKNSGFPNLARFCRNSGHGIAGINDQVRPFGQLLIVHRLVRGGD